MRSSFAGARARPADHDDDRSHEVTVYAPDRLRHDPEVAAFLRIWNELVTWCPPNPGQRTE